jgi:acetyl esterase/lipase
MDMKSKWVLVGGGLLGFLWWRRNERRSIRDDKLSTKALTPAKISPTYTKSFGPHEKQKLDVYIPPNIRSGAPIFFMVHGGAWRLGDKAADAVITNKYRHWAEGKGYIFVSTNYRLDVHPVREAEDVASALAYGQRNAATWGGDPNKIVVVGHSAGAHLATLVTTNRKLAEAKGLSPWLGTVALDSAAYDVVRIMSREHQRFYDKAFGRSRDLWAAASPLLLFDGKLNSGAFYGFCNAHREDDGCAQTQEYVTKVSSAGTRALFSTEDKSHTEMNEHLGTGDSFTKKVDAFFKSLGLP